MPWSRVLPLLLAAASGRATGSGCHPITVDLCRNVGYNLTASPNLLGHETQADADFTLKTFSPLIQYGCSAQLSFFLCSVYVPMCNDKVPAPIGPCRTLCESVRARCFPVLQGFGFPWPMALDCAKFPERNDQNSMCMEGPGEVGLGIAPARIKLPPERLPDTSVCSQFARPGMYFPTNASDHCLQLCAADVLFTRTDKDLAEVWLTVLSSLCFLGCLFALLSGRRSSPDRPLGFLGLCYALVAAGWGLRLALGRGQVACYPNPASPHGPPLLAQRGLGNAHCALVFFLTYYFDNAISIWWVILLASWTSGGWGEDRFQRYAPALHLLAWGLPASLVIAALVLRYVDADELTGMCSVGNHSSWALLTLVALPHSVTLLLLLSMAAIGLPSWGARRALLACLYLGPAAGTTASLWFRYWHHTDWILALPPSPTPRSLPSPPLWIFLFRCVTTLATGTIVSVWACLPSSGDTCRATLYPEAPKKPPMVAASKSPHSLYYYQQPRVHRTRRKRKPKTGGETLV